MKKLTDSSSTPPLKASMMNLSLQRANNHSVKLNASHLEQWFAQVESNLIKKGSQPNTQAIHASTASLAGQSLSRFGMKSALDVLQFLKSPEGKTVLALIGKELAELDSIEERIRKDKFNLKQLKHDSLAYLLLGLMHKRSKRLHRLYDAIQQDLEKKSKYEQTLAKKRRLTQEETEYDIAKKYVLHLYRHVDAYARASDAMEQRLNLQLNESQELEQDLNEIETMIESAAKQYSFYEQYVADAHTDIETELPSIDSIEQKLAQITAEIKDQTQLISDLAETDDTSEFMKQIKIHRAMHLQQQMWKDILAVAKGEKVFYTAEGIATTNYHDAQFILQRDQKIVMHDGKYYLLSAGQQFDDLSSEERDERAQAYFQLRPQILGVKQLLEHKHGVEQRAHQERKSDLSLRSAMMQEQMITLSNQIVQVQADRAQAQSLLDAAQAAMPKPASATNGAAPTRTPAAPAPIATPSPTSRPATYPRCVANSYKQILQLMRNNPTERAIQWLNNIVSQSGDPQMLKQLNTLSPGKPIPQGLMNLLLARKDLGRLSVSPASPDAAKAQLNPPSGSMAVPTPTASKAPSPFSIKPKI